LSFQSLVTVLVVDCYSLVVAGAAVAEGPT
jgi:hypothetical protein